MPSKNGTPPAKALAERFFARFKGMERAHGRAYIGNKVSEKGKLEARGQTVYAPMTATLWEQHLAGEYSLGGIPITEDNTCAWGAIDIDKYDIDVAKVAEDVAGAGLPLIVCRTKSGGAHLYAFTTEPVPAGLLRGKMMEWAILLGHSGVEIFPKQTKLAGQNDYGNWINLPYFDAGHTLRYAVVNGQQLSAEKFLDLADLIALTPISLVNFQPEAVTEFQEWLENGPPCLQSLAKAGFGEGSRNNGLFNIGVYLRKRYGDDNWEEKVDQYNQKFFTPPLGHKEVAHIVKSLGRKAYEYKCHDEPIVSVCNRQICFTRKFGVGQGEGDPGVVFGPLVKIKTEPPIWIWDVDGARVELTTQELKDQGRFHSRVIESVNKWPLPVKPKQWADLVRKALERVEQQDVPPDATQEGQMWAHLDQYCTGRAMGRDKEDLLVHKTWTDPETNRTYFSATHFKQYLEQQRMRVDEKTLWKWLRDRGATHKFFNIKGKGINTWSVPAFTIQSEAFDPVKLEEM